MLFVINAAIDEIASVAIAFLMDSGKRASWISTPSILIPQARVASFKLVHKFSEIFRKNTSNVKKFWLLST